MAFLIETIGQDTPDLLPGNAPLPLPSPVRSEALIDDALTKNPDQAVKERKLGEELRQTPETIKADPILSKTTRDKRLVQQRLSESPVTNRHLSTVPGAMDAASDSVEELSLFENLAAGIGERFFNLAGSITRFTGTTADTAADVLEQIVPLGRIGFDFTGDVPKFEWRPSTQVDLDEESPLLPIARDFEGLNLGYKQGTTWKDFKDKPLTNFLPFALEQGIVSMADMVAVMSNMPAYIVARSGEIGQTRAVNDGLVDATVEDFVKAAPAATASALLERLGTRGILGIGDSLATGSLKEIAKATAKGAGKEAGTEFTQEVIESIGETLGTERGFDLPETLERGLQGLVGGLGFGGSVRGATATVEAVQIRKNQRAMERLNKLSKESKYKQRDKDRASELETTVLEENSVESVSIPVEQIMEMAEKHEEGPAAFISELGVSREFVEAMRAVPEATVKAEEETLVPTPVTIKVTASKFAQHILGTNKYDIVANDIVLNGLVQRTAERVAGEAFKQTAKLDIKKPTRLLETLKRLKVKTTAQAIRGVRAAFKKGVSKAKGDKKESQAIAVDLVKASPISKENRAKFLTQIKNIDSFEQLEKQLPIIENKISNLMAKEWQQKLRAALKSVVKKTKAPAKGEGKFNAEIQGVMDTARDILNMSKANARAQLEENLSLPNPLQALENTLLSLVSQGSDINANIAERTLQSLVDLKDEGRAAAALRQLTKRTAILDATQEASDAVTSDTDVDLVNTTTLAGRILKGFKQKTAELGALHNAWDEILDITLNKKGVNVTSLIKKLGMSPVLQKTKGRIIKWQSQLNEMGMKAYGVTSQKKFIDEIYESAIRHDLGTFINENGKKVRLQYTRDEARKWWMEMQDPTINDAYTAKSGNAYTPEMMNAIRDLLTQGDLNYAQAQLDFYAKTYDEVNKVYSRMFGVNLPRTINYSPIQRDKGATPLDTEDAIIGEDNVLVEELKLRRTLAGSLKKRQANPFAILQRSDVGTMNRWQHDIAHFIETAEKAAFIHGVFSNSRLRKEIGTINGKAMVEQIDGMIRDFTTGYPGRGRVAERQINAFNRGFARSVLALKATIGMKQFPSYFAMAENIPLVEFTKGSAKFLANPKKYIKLLYGSSPLMQQRGSSLDFELAKIGASDKVLTQLRQHQTVDNFLMAFIKYGDRLPIYMGGTARYIYNTEVKKMSHKEAMVDFESHTASTQQSTDIDKMSDLQRGGAIGRTFTMFMTARLSLLRGELRAIRQFKRGKITPKEFGKRLALYHFVIPMMIQGIASGFRFEPEKQIRAMLLGQLNSFVIFGDILNWAVTGMIEGDAFDGAGDIPLVETLKDAWTGVDDAFNAVDMEEFMEASGEMADAAGLFIGEPVEQIRHIIIGGMKIAEGDVKEGAMLILGWSPTVAEESSED